MEVIALTGAANVGKTETLNIVYQILLMNGYVQVPGYFQDLGNGDCLDVFEKSGIRIGIATQGDYAAPYRLSLKNHLQKLNSAGCKKAICACTNTKPKVIADVYACSTPAPTFIKKSREPNVSLRRIVNGISANSVFAKI